MDVTQVLYVISMFLVSTTPRFGRTRIDRYPTSKSVRINEEVNFNCSVACGSCDECAAKVRWYKDDDSSPSQNKWESLPIACENVPTSVSECCVISTFKINITSEELNGTSIQCSTIHSDSDGVITVYNSGMAKGKHCGDLNYLPKALGCTPLDTVK